MTAANDDTGATARGSALDVLAVFFRLGLTSFGGAVAHLGYFREAFVVRRRWLADAAYADLAGINAAVVGLLLAALYDPVWTSAIHTAADAGLALAAFALLVVWRVPPWLVVALSAAGGWALTSAGL